MANPVLFVTTTHLATQVHLACSNSEALRATACIVHYLAALTGMDTEQVLDRIRDLVAEEDAEAEDGLGPDLIGYDPS